MTDTATLDPKAPVVREAPESRRFQIPDLDRHAGWVIPRLKRAYPHLDDRTLAGWLRGLVYNPEFLFLYQENACALAQVERAYTLNPRPIVKEHFVFCRNEDAAEDAVWFYDEFKRWARNQDAEVIILSALSDVPKERIKSRFGRLFETPQIFARLQKE